MLKRKSGGFTLVELVVVMAVIAIISTLAVSITSGTMSLRTENEDKIAVVEMNNIFMSKWGAESYAYPQTAADIKLILSENGYEWNEPGQSSAEYWFDAMSGKIKLGKLRSDRVVFEDGTEALLEPNSKIITADGFIDGYIYMGQKYRAYLDEFNSIDVDGGADTAAQKLSELLSRSDVPEYIRKSLRTLAEHAIFIGESNALAFTGVATIDEEDDWYTFAPIGEVTDSHTVAVFTDKSIGINEQLKNSYIKSLYIPSDVSVTFNENSFDDTWVQRVLINDDVDYGKLVNHSSNYDENGFTMDVSVLRKYYPSELPEYDLMTLSVEKYLELYDEMKASTHEFQDYYNDELRNKNDIEALYNGFYKLRRPSDRRYVVKIREELYGHITTLNENKIELEELYNKVKTYKPSSELLLKGLTGSPENYNLDFLSDIRSSKKGWNALDNFGKLIDDFWTDGNVLKLVLGKQLFTAEQKGNGYVTLIGALGDEIKFDFTVNGAYESIGISGVKINSSALLKAEGEKLNGEFYGTLDKSGVGAIVTPVSTTSGDYIHSAEKLVVTSVDTVAVTNGSGVKVSKTSSDVAVKVKVSSYLNPAICSVYEVPLKGNACNVFKSSEFDSVDTKNYGVALHTDVTYASKNTWTIPSGRTAFGNGYTFTNVNMEAETMTTAKASGMFRFPAVVTAYGTVKDLKIVARTGDAIGLKNRFQAIACTENAETESSLGKFGWVDVITGNITGDKWSGVRKSITGKVKAKYGPITIVSKRLAAVRVYGSGSLSNCFVVGGQYGVHLVGSESQTGKNNLDNVWVKNSLAANIYISDNEGAKQFINIKGVHTYNESNMAPAFPILIEPKIVAVSTKEERFDHVYGYGMCLKYCYSLLENKLSVNVNGFFVYNIVTKDQFFQMLFDNMKQNALMITDELRTLGVNYFENNISDIINDLGLSGTFNVPIYYGEQCFSQIYDQQYTFADSGNKEGVSAGKKVKTRSGFANLISGYNASDRGVKAYWLAGSNEVALSCYIVKTNHGGNWFDPAVKP